MLPKKERITRGSEIAAIRKRKKIHLASPLLYVTGEINKLSYPRLAVICRGQLGNAVKRNRTKRVIMSAYIKIRHKINKNIDYLIIPKKAIENSREAEDHLRKLLLNNG